MYERVCGSCKHCSRDICDVDFHYVSVIDLSDFHCKKWKCIVDMDENEEDDSTEKW